MSWCVQVEGAQADKVVYIMGRVDMQSSTNLNIFQRILLEYFYKPMERNCRNQTDSWQIPRERLIEVGMTYEVGSLQQADPAWDVITNSSAALRRPDLAGQQK